MKLPNFKKGFTLIEILLVVSILSVILVVVFAALNPAQRLADARDARRWNDVNQMLTAVHECIVDGNTASTCYGSLTNDTVYEIVSNSVSTSCNAAPCTGNADTDLNVALTGNCADLEATLVDGSTAYLASIAADPSGTATDHSEYVIKVSNGIVTIGSCAGEATGSIKVSR